MKPSLEPYINRKIIILNKHNSIKEASFAMSCNQVGSLIITDDRGNMCGIVTDRDLACQLGPSLLTLESPLEKVMTDEFISINDNQSIEDVILLMKENGIRRIPVIHRSLKKGTVRCIGMVSLDDLLAAKEVNMEDVVEIVKSQIMRRQIYHHTHKKSGRLETSYYTFVNKIAKELNLEKRVSEKFILEFSGAIVRRLHYTGANQFIHQLPKKLHRILLDLPSGPDRKINSEFILSNMASFLNLDRNKVRKLIRKYWKTLNEIVDPNEMYQVLNQLPLDCKKLLVSNVNIKELENLVNGWLPKSTMQMNITDEC